MSSTVRDKLMIARPYLVFVPALAVLLGWASIRPDGSAWVNFGLCLAAGLLVWTLLEWGLHRAMHLGFKSRLLQRIQFKAHLRHHDHPRDLPRSVARLRVSVPASVAILGAAYLLLGSLALAMFFTSGVIIGYLWYESVHLVAHLRWRVPLLSGLCRYHLRHHFSDAQRGFGVTSPLWDWAFGTLPKRRRGHETANLEQTD